MAELAVASWISICPYAWFSPTLLTSGTYSSSGPTSLSSFSGPSLAQPMRAGLDIWIYPLGARSDAHFSLSAISSLFDTIEGDAIESSFVVGYSF